MAVQFVAKPDWIFPLDLFLPEQLFIEQFNLRIPITDSLPYLKSNGLAFLEPSHFSQFLAFSILIELAYFRRFPRLALLGSAYLTSFSGTGAILLFIIAAPLMVRSRQYLMLTCLASGIMLLPWLYDIFPFSLFMARIDEFANPLGSGSMRFLGPYWLTWDVMLGHPAALLFGYGPGSVGGIKGSFDYEVADTSWLKLLVDGRCDRSRQFPSILSLRAAGALARPTAIVRVLGAVFASWRLLELFLCAISVRCPGRMATNYDRSQRTRANILV